jgi:hypothetical protein
MLLDRGVTTTVAKKHGPTNIFSTTTKIARKKNLLASFAFVHARLLPKVLYC